jgi:hypothetical protein
MSAYQRRLSAATKEKIVMLEPNDFFHNQVKQCRAQAESAANKDDRDFWLQLAHRWENLSLTGAGSRTEQKPDGAPPKLEKKPFAKQFARGHAA